MSGYPSFAGIWDPRGATDLRPRLRDWTPTAVLESGPLAVAAVGADLRAPVAVDGYLDNLDDLAPGPAPWPERLHSAWLRDGDDLIAALRGSFVLVLWDAERERAVLARDAMGGRPLFVHDDGSRTTFGTDLRLLLAVLPSTPAVDDVTVAAWAASQQELGARTLYAGVERLPAGGLLVLESAKRGPVRLPASTPAAMLPVDKDLVTRGLRDQLVAAVDRAVGGRPAGVLLSGGLDSTSVAAAAVAGGSTPIAYSAVFPDHPLIDESAYSGALTARYGLQHRRLVVRGGSVLRGALDYLDRWGAPTLSTTGFYGVELRRQAERDGVEVLLDGEGGDELFATRVHAIADYLLARDPRRAWELVTAFPTVGEHPSIRLRLQLILRWGVRPLLPRPRPERPPDAGLLQSRWRRRLRQVPLVADWRSRGRPLHLAYATQATLGELEGQGLAEHFARLGRSGGVRERHPLRDQRLAEWLLRVPPQFFFSPNMTRPLQRSAMWDDLPDDVRRKSRKAPFDGLRTTSLAGPDQPLARDLLGADARLGRYVQSRTLSRLAAGPAAGHEREWSAQVFPLIVLESWLREVEDPGWAHRTADAYRLPAAELQWR